MMLPFYPKGIVLKLMTQSCYLSVKVIPNAPKNQIIGWEDDELKVKITTIPEKGKANDALVRFLAKSLQISPSCLNIVSGLTSRHKRLLINGVSSEQVFSLLKKL
ncbi:hypothetical protein PHSC3_001650 [Chlamydiales bacterium STE3]|nr:hypothetical protein PHSC3_001650 [Chlamydiales bacterium STE3]